MTIIPTQFVEIHDLPSRGQGCVDLFGMDSQESNSRKDLVKDHGHLMLESHRAMAKICWWKFVTVNNGTL